MSRFGKHSFEWLIGLLCLLTTACGTAQRSVSAGQVPSNLLRQARPIGKGERFHPPVTGPVIGACRGELGRRVGVHVEVFGANRVVLLPSGIGTKPPRRESAGRISHARCYGSLLTREPTGLVLVRPGSRLLLADLFRSWGQPLSPTRVASFAASRAAAVRVFVNGHRWPGPPGRVPLRRHAEIVLEAGPYVPPHPSYTFPPGT